MSSWFPVLSVLKLLVYVAVTISCGRGCEGVVYVSDRESRRRTDFPESLALRRSSVQERLYLRKFVCFMSSSFKWIILVVSTLFVWKMFQSINSFPSISFESLTLLVRTERI